MALESLFSKGLGLGAVVKRVPGLQCRAAVNENARVTLTPKKLPPGSMGVPGIGETQDWTDDQEGFYDSRWKRHGEIYKTHLFGFPTVVVTTPEAASKLLISNGDSLKAVSPGSTGPLLGPHFVNHEEGEQHTRLRKLLMKHLQPDSLKSLVPAIEELAKQHLSNWSNGSIIKFANEIKRYTLGAGMLVFLGPLAPINAAELTQEFAELEKGFASPPINEPGSQYFESMQVRDRILKQINEIVQRRLTDKNTERRKDILDSLIDQEDPLPQNVIDDNVVGTLYASFRTTGAAISFMVKYLHDHPDVLQELKDRLRADFKLELKHFAVMMYLSPEAEQEEIRSRKAPGDSLSWEDFNDMTFSSQVVQESMRLSNIVGIQYRQVEKDIEYKDYVIPENWRLLSLQRQWHLDPAVFPDPFKFDPSRFKTPKPNLKPFGIGNHFCAGHELARVELLVFLHHMTTKFRWEIMEDGPVKMQIFPNPHASLPLKLTQL